MKRFWLILAIVAAFVIGGVVVAVAMGAKVAAPARSAFHYPWTMLSAEAETMVDCVECHEPEKFHTCDTCHDDHGSAEMANVPFDDLILLQGDVPEPGYIPVNDILPYRDQPGTHVTLLDFLAEHGVSDFESVTLASRDEGWITVDRDNLTAEALLLPHVDGVRFAAENLHVSTWLKGVWRIVVVGPDKPLTLDGYRTSIGRLLLGPTSSVTIEQTDVMLRSETDGQIRKAKTASRIEGAGLEKIVADPGFDTLLVRDASGEEHTLSAADARGAVLAQMGPQIVLVLPSRGRAQWIGDVVELISEE
ncbi:MAG: hypothetical protein P8189_17770 [Anaerolineae bacterium]|jgi:hypothetical protein